jgi:hypothetical protein
MATTTFTDAAAANVNFATNGLPDPQSVSVTWSGTNNGGNPISGTATFNSPGPSSDIGTQQGSQFNFAFPSTISVGADTYDLISTSQTSPFPTPTGSPPPHPTNPPPTTITGTYQKHVVAVNHPPLITPLTANVDLGQIVGCLNNATPPVIATSVSVAYTAEAGADAKNFNVYATFNGDTNTKTLIATVFDADGNLPLASIVATPSSDTLTFTGPGTHSLAYSTSVTATDTTTPTPLSDTETCPLTGSKVTVQVIYNVDDANFFLPPLDDNSVTLVKRGRAVPVKFQLFDCDGTTPITTGSHTISVAFQAGCTPAGVVDVDDAGLSGDNGINFRYDPTGQQWIFNLKTNTSYGLGDTYKITATLDDETTHDVSIGIKK